LSRHSTRAPITHIQSPCSLQDSLKTMEKTGKAHVNIKNVANDALGQSLRSKASRKITFGAIVFFFTVFVAIAISIFFIISAPHQGATGPLAFFSYTLYQMGHVLAPIFRFIVTSIDWIRLPTLNTTLILDGLQHPVEVYWDKYGVPHVYAKNRNDMFYAMGYLHAQDRLWQMELQRRVVTGTMSEVFGETTLTVDRIFRTLGLFHKAKNDWTVFEKSHREYVKGFTAYVEGVNEYVRKKSSQLPLEFTILGIEPTEWNIQEVLALGRLTCWQLTAGDQTEFPRLIFQEILGPQLTQDFDILYEDTNPSTLNFLKDKGIFEFNPQVEGLDLNRILPPYIRSHGASNAWSIHGNLTKSGKPIVANDPHLMSSSPSPWYQMHLVSESKTEPFNAIGVTLPGLPIIAIGHNNRIAWGMTVSMVDLKDHFVEHFFPNGTYEYKGRAIEPTRRVETIHIKGKPSYTEHVIETVHGPIISTFLPVFNQTASSVLHKFQDNGVSVAVAYASVALMNESTQAEGQWLLNIAENWDDFVNAVHKMDIGSFNIIYGDADGNIGYYLSGHIPIRQKGNGLVPVPGWTGEYDWIGFVPPSERPYTLNPKSGYIVSANHKIVSDDYKYFMGKIWNNGYRGRRIEDIIKEFKNKGMKMGVKENERIHLDVISIPGIEFSRKLLSYISKERMSHLENVTLSILRDWDGSMHISSVAASIYQLTRSALLRRVLLSRIPSAMARHLRGVSFTPISNFAEYLGHDIVNLLRLLDNEHSEWWVKLGGRAQTLRDSLNDTIQWLIHEFGSDPSSWHWGKIHQQTFVHLLSKQKPFNLVFDVGPVPIFGDDDTVARSGFIRDENLKPFDVVIGTSYRQIVDFSDFDQSKWIMPPGQSARLSSPHHSDLLPLWAAGKYTDMLWSKSKIVANSCQKTLLQPKVPTGSY
jgi:penicillin amidase